MRFILLLSIVLLAMSMSGATACICTADYTPVCATNGRTYSNRCSMKCDRASFRHYGACGGRT